MTLGLPDDTVPGTPGHPGDHNTLHTWANAHSSDTANPHDVTAVQAGAEPSGSVAAHSAVTTGVHGVGASTVESEVGSQAKVDAHNAGEPHVAAPSQLGTPAVPAFDVWRQPDPGLTVWVVVTVRHLAVAPGETSRVEVALRPGGSGDGTVVAHSQHQRSLLATGTTTPRIPISFTVPAGWSYRFLRTAGTNADVQALAEVK